MVRILKLSAYFLMIVGSLLTMIGFTISLPVMFVTGLWLFLIAGGVGCATMLKELFDERK